MVGPVSVIISLCIIIKQQKDLTRYIQTQHFADWRARGIITSVSYWAGSGHRRARIRLRLNPGAAALQQMPLGGMAPRQQQVMLTCPPGSGPGTPLQIQINGMLASLVVPPGVSPGQQFLAVVSVPMEVQPQQQVNQPSLRVPAQPTVPSVPASPKQQQQQPVAMPMAIPLAAPVAIGGGGAGQYTVQGTTVVPQAQNNGSVSRNQVAPITTPTVSGMISL